MTEPKRLLLDPDAPAFARHLIEAWERERPTPESRARTLVALGLGAAAQAGGVAGAGIAAKTSTAPKAIASGLAWGKWSALAVVAMAGVTMAVAERSATERPAPPPLAVAGREPARSTPAKVVEQPPSREAPTPEAPAVALSDLPIATEMGSPSKVASHAAPIPLRDQLAAIAQVRAAVDAQDGARAERLVDAYERKWPTGAFAQEAEVLRVQALLEQGDRAGAQRAGAAFLAAYPKSPHVARVRALLSSDP